MFYINKMQNIMQDFLALEDEINKPLQSPKRN